MQGDILLLVLIPESNEKLKLMNLQREILKHTGDPSAMELEPFVPILYLKEGNKNTDDIRENIKKTLKEKKLIHVSQALQLKNLTKVEKSIFINLNPVDYLINLRETLLRENPTLFSLEPPQGRDIPLFNGILLIRRIESKTTPQLKPKISTVRKLKLGIEEITYTTSETLWKFTELFRVHLG